VGLRKNKRVAQVSELAEVWRVNTSALLGEPDQNGAAVKKSQRHKRSDRRSPSAPRWALSGEQECQKVCGCDSRQHT